MSAHSRKLLHVDAVVENDGLTSIAVVDRTADDARPIVSRIIRCTGSVEAEMRAMILAMHLAEKSRWKLCTFRCDALGPVRMIQGIADCRPENLHGLLKQARGMIDAHDGWEVEWVKRTHNSSAHAMAGQIMRAYKHGREHGRNGVEPMLKTTPTRYVQGEWEV